MVFYDLIASSWVWILCFLVAQASIWHGTKELKLKYKTELSDYLLDLISLVDGWGYADRDTPHSDIETERSGAIALIGVLGRDFKFLRPVCKDFLVTSRDRLGSDYVVLADNKSWDGDWSKLKTGTRLFIKRGYREEVELALEIIDSKTVAVRAKALSTSLCRWLKRVFGLFAKLRVKMQD